MPIGVFVNSISILCGGIIGGYIGKKVPARVKEALPVILGFAAITMGITKVIEIKNLTIVILALIIGAIIGELIKIEDWLEDFVRKSINKFNKEEKEDEKKTKMLVIVILAFCASGTGIYGAINEGFTGDTSILFSKSILDFFTAITFGSIIGYRISLICIPQILISLTLYFGAAFISPFFKENILGNFYAIGGVITIMIGCKIARISNTKVSNMLPSLVLVIIISMFQ